MARADTLRFKEILAPVDGSAPSDRAIDLAIRLAKTVGGSLTFCHVIHVMPPMHDGGGFAYEQLTKEAADNGRTLLDLAMKRAEEAGVSATTELAQGPVVDSILDVARTRHADVIIMGTHGRGALGRVFLGSKTADVLARTKIPVLVCPARDDGGKT